MMFQKRVDRAMEHSAARREGASEEYDPKGHREELEPADLMEKGDLPAMVIAALLTFLPICLLLLLLMVAAGAVFFLL